MSANVHVKNLVLDATPLITQPYTHYQNFAERFYTTPTVFAEIKDVQARKNLEIWQSLGSLHLVHPRAESIERVSNFAKLTGDFSVLSANDIHILALAYQIETEANNGDWRLRKRPGDSLETAELKTVEWERGHLKEVQKKKKNRRRGGKKQREKKEAREQASAEVKGEELGEEEPKEEESREEGETLKEQEKEVKKVQFDTPAEANEEVNEAIVELNEDYLEEDDDGDWITPDTLTETMIKDSGEDTTGGKGVEAADNLMVDKLNSPRNQLALATGDFAVQNVALQLNLNLMNFTSGLRIKRLRNYMLRCHACFQMFPLPKDGKPKHFCPSCGGQGTLLRCAVSVDSSTGKVTPHLKNNFQWNNRGNRYSMASPLSKNAVKRYGKKGFDHVKNNNQQSDVLLLREDQKEYQQMMKQDAWTKKHNEKVLNNWTSGGSADNFISPFAITGLKHHSVRVGEGRHVNSSKRRK